MVMDKLMTGNQSGQYMPPWTMGLISLIPHTCSYDSTCIVEHYGYFVRWICGSCGYMTNSTADLYVHSKPQRLPFLKL
jgi:hypothetical protein